jgi:thiol-disulfide isomerase/thioredoxin
MKSLLCLGLLLTALSQNAFAKTPGEIEVGGTLPETAMRGLMGPSAKLSEFRGKPLVINVWASWCAPCRQEMASLDRLAQLSGGKQFAVIGISTDDYPQAAGAFIKHSKTQFRQFIDHQLVLENMLGADHIPLTVLVNAKGRVLYKFHGTKEWDQPDAVKLISETFKIKM